MTPEERIRRVLAMTGGTMPIGVVVADEREQQEARELLQGKRNARLVTPMTESERRGA